MPLFTASATCVMPLSESAAALRRFLHRGARIGACQPLAERRLFMRADAVAARAVQIRHDRKIGPAERCRRRTIAASPSMARQPIIESRAPATWRVLRSSCARAPSARLNQRISPMPQLIGSNGGVHHVLDGARMRACERVLRQQSRRRPFVLDIFEDDRRIEDRRIAVDQRRHFAARIGFQEFLVGLSVPIAAGILVS